MKLHLLLILAILTICFCKYQPSVGLEFDDGWYDDQGPDKLLIISNDGIENWGESITLTSPNSVPRCDDGTLPDTVMRSYITDVKGCEDLCTVQVSRADSKSDDVITMTNMVIDDCKGSDGLVDASIGWIQTDLGKIDSSEDVVFILSLNGRGVIELSSNRVMFHSYCE